MSKVSADTANKIAMRSKRALETMHEIKCRIEQTSLPIYVTVIIGMLLNSPF